LTPGDARGIMKLMGWLHDITAILGAVPWERFIPKKKVRWEELGELFHEYREPLETKPKEPCLPCGNWHLTAIAGALEEAVREARNKGIEHPDTLFQLKRAERELVNAERGDFIPVKIVDLPEADKRIVEWVMPKFKELRGEFDKLAETKSIEHLEKLAAKASQYDEQYYRMMWERTHPEIATKETCEECVALEALKTWLERRKERS